MLSTDRSRPGGPDWLRETGADDVVSARLDNARRYHQQRADRIYDPRQRTIGIDKDALDAQVREKQRRNLMQKTLNDAYESESVRQSTLGALLQDREKSERRQAQSDVETFRRTFQQRETAREWDLNDPRALAQDLPARVSDDDPRLGPASIQKFIGEDLAKAQRELRQKEQARKWAEKQAWEKANRERQERALQASEQRAALEADDWAAKLNEDEMLAKKLMDKAVSNFNLAMGREKAALTAQVAAQEEADKLTEINNHLVSDLLTENPDTAQSALGQHRKVPYQYKGMSGSEKERIRREQLEQINANKQRRHLEMVQESQWEAQQEEQSRQAALLEREEMRRRSEMERRQLLENQLLAEEQRARNFHMEKNVYRTAPQEDFFTQFNKQTFTR